MKLLLAEDESAMSDAVQEILTHHHYSVDCVDNGSDALAYAQDQAYDGIILDIMMQGLDGLQVLQRLRQAGSHTPVLLLTARGQLEDRIRGLNLGADDYLPKPFAMGELLARVQAMLRRRDNYVPDQVVMGNLTLDCSRFILSGPGGHLPLSKLEFQLLELLLVNHDIFFPAEKLLERIWGYDSDVEIGTVWVYISYLRKKLQTLNANVEIISRRGIGYAARLDSTAAISAQADS